MGGKIIPRIRITSPKVLAEVEAELGNTISLSIKCYFFVSRISIMLLLGVQG